MPRSLWLGLLPILVLGWLLWARPTWLMNLVKRVDVSPETGAALVVKYDCRQCHVIAGKGGLTGPNLDRVFLYRTEDELRRWLRNPKAVNPRTPMPNFHLSENEIDALLRYLKQNAQVQP